MISLQERINEALNFVNEKNKIDEDIMKKVLSLLKKAKTMFRKDIMGELLKQGYSRIPISHSLAELVDLGGIKAKEVDVPDLDDKATQYTIVK